MLFGHLLYLFIGGKMNRSILLIEDDSDIQFNLRLFLEMEGFEVFQAFNGKEALAFLESTKSQIRVILLDLMMPVMSGWEFLDAVKNMPIRNLSNPLPPIILLSASRELLPTALKNQLDFVVKPIDIDRLLNTIEKNLEKAA